MLSLTKNVKELYEDWYQDCVFCPENGEILYSIMFADELTGKIFLMEDKPNHYTFADLMCAIEAVIISNNL